MKDDVCILIIKLTQSINDGHGERVFYHVLHDAALDAHDALPCAMSDVPDDAPDDVLGDVLDVVPDDVLDDALYYATHDFPHDCFFGYVLYDAL